MHIMSLFKTSAQEALDTRSHLKKKLMNPLVNKERSRLWSVGSRNYNEAEDPHHILFTKGYWILENCSSLVWFCYLSGVLVLWKGVWVLLVVGFTTGVLFVPVFIYTLLYCILHIICKLSPWHGRQNLKFCLSFLSPIASEPCGV